MENQKIGGFFRALIVSLDKKLLCSTLCQSTHKVPETEQ